MSEIKVLVVEDTPSVRDWLVHALADSPGISVVATASDGEEAIETAVRIKPDVITMDVHMPKMGGLDATRRIMEICPIPIILVSGSTLSPDMAFMALEAGALAFVSCPSYPGLDACAREIVQTVRTMSEVKLVRRWSKTSRRHPGSEAPMEIVVIGASTGGPLVLQTILSSMPSNFPLPILIVQHMTPGFVQRFADWLGETSTLPVSLARDGEALFASHVYIAPDGRHMKMEQGGRVFLTDDEPENGLKPSVSFLFRSAAAHYGKKVLAGLLTGMGKDGADELLLLKQAGAITFVQDSDSAVVYGMAGEAVRLNAANYVLAPDQIASFLACMANKRVQT